ncbi:MAG: WbqC family protein [Terracidiphilus sp.]
MKRTTNDNEKSTTAAIMQPYFLPYIGYFQLIAAVNLFIVYDNIKYTKKGWINRNRFLCNGRDVMFSLPLKGDSDLLDIRDRRLAADFNGGRLVNQLTAAYRKAPYFEHAFPIVEEILHQKEENLFQFLYHSIVLICKHIGITTEIRISSDIPIDHSLKNQDKVLALCETVGSNVYVNAIGGLELYSKDDFLARNIKLKFIRSKPFQYRQFDDEFVPWLSIVDVLMFNARETIREAVHSNYELI